MLTTDLKPTTQGNSVILKEDLKQVNRILSLFLSERQSYVGTITVSREEQCWNALLEITTREVDKVRLTRAEVPIRE